MSTNPNSRNGKSNMLNKEFAMKKGISISHITIKYAHKFRKQRKNRCKHKTKLFRCEYGIAKQFFQCALAEPIRKMFYISVGLSFFIRSAYANVKLLPNEWQCCVLNQRVGTSHIASNGNSKFMCMYVVHRLCRLYKLKRNKNKAKQT